MKPAALLLANLLIALLMATVPGAAAAKLPVPAETPESKAKAQEAAAKVAAAAKRDAEDLSRYQDKAAANYQQRQSK
jgi:hypothetical protein